MNTMTVDNFTKNITGKTELITSANGYLMLVTFFSDDYEFTPDDQSYFEERSQSWSDNSLQDGIEPFFWNKTNQMGIITFGLIKD